MGDTAPGTDTGRLRFEMRDLLGVGSFGEVYLATLTTQAGIRQDVAVKVLNRDLDPRSQPVERLRDEGRILGKLNHPVILQVRDLIVLEGRVGLVTEYVQGADLVDVIHRTNGLDPRVALEIIGLVSDALDTAYHVTGFDGQRLRLVHRDIKPANLRLTPHGTVKVLDFGIAKAQAPDRETSTTHLVLMGSVPYMGPEVLHMDVEEADMPRDVYALGCTLYESITGKLFSAGLKHGDLRRETARPDRFYAFRQGRLDLLPADLPTPVRQLIASMLTYEAKERPTAREVAERAHEIADKLPGPTLRRWARSFDWPPPDGGVGPWSGRNMSETTILTRSGPTDATLPVEVPVPPPAVAARSVGSEPARPAGSEVASVDDEPIVTRPASPMRWAWVPLLLALVGGGAWWAMSSGGSAAPPQPAVAVSPPAPKPVPAQAKTLPVPAPAPIPVPVAPEPAAIVAPEPVAAPPVAPTTTATAPKPAASPKPAAAPKPKPAAPVEAPPAEPARILIDARGGLPVELRGKSGTRGAGNVPAGTWEVWADFGDGFVRALSVKAEAGKDYEVFCNRTLQSCTPK